MSFYRTYLTIGNLSWAKSGNKEVIFINNHYIEVILNQ
jgi:hypothetical protein